MDIKEQMHDMYEKQKQVLKEYEQMIKIYESSDLTRENENMKNELERLKENISRLQKERNILYEQNNELRVSLKEQILDERLTILKLSKKKMETYFDNQFSEWGNDLTALQKDLIQKLKQCKEKASTHLGIEREIFVEEISRLNSRVESAIAESRKPVEAMKEDMRRLTDDRIDAMKAAPIREDVVYKRMKQNDLEMKIGLSWVNKIGIILIMLGIGAASQYTYAHFFNAYMKGIFFFLLGGLFLGGGEWLYRKNKDVFSKGLIGGGIGILYCSTFFSFFLLQIISMNAGIGLSIVITALGVLLSLRYHSKTICALALVGGYLPFFSFVFYYGLSEQSIYVAIGYLLILNVLILAVSFYKKWNIVSVISFVLHVPSCIYLVFHAQVIAVGIIYAIVAFAVYVAITLAYPLRYKIHLEYPEIILLGFNTVISATVIFGLVEKAGVEDARALVAVGFCLVYVLLGCFISIKLPGETAVKLLFFITGLTFSVMVIPLQFGIRWTSLGWLIQGVLFIIYGYKHRLKLMERTGWIVFALCMFLFYTTDISVFSLAQENNHFHFKYFSIIVGMIIVLYVYVNALFHKDTTILNAKKNFIMGYKYFVLCNFYVYTIYNGMRLFDKYSSLQRYKTFYGFMFFSLLTLLIAYSYSKIPLVYDQVVRYGNIGLYILVDVICIFMNIGVRVLGRDYNQEQSITAFILLIAFNIVVFLNLRELLISWMRKSAMSFELYPIFLSIFLLGNGTLFLFGQFNLEFIHFSFSLLYIGLGAGCISYGFKRYYTSVRQFGLGITLLAVAKLFVYDLSFLSIFGKMAAYFIFGLTLLGISYLYQRLKNSIEKRSSLEENR